MIDYEFASYQESKSILLTEDEYLSKLTDYEFALKMLSDKPVQKEDYLKFLEGCILTWDEGEVGELREVFESVQEGLKGLKLSPDFPIMLIKTDGREEWNSAYTRNQAIILPVAKLKRYNNKRLARLLIHETFHIITRTYPGIRNILYGLIGFQKINEIELPRDIRQIKITNPDAPFYNYYTTVLYREKKVPVVPIIALAEGRDNVNNKQDILNSITTRLLTVKKAEKSWEPVVGNGESVILKPGEVEGLMEGLNISTDSLDPEEILAEIFVEAALGDRDRKKTRIYQQLAKILF